MRLGELEGLEAVTLRVDVFVSMPIIHEALAHVLGVNPGILQVRCTTRCTSAIVGKSAVSVGVLAPDWEVSREIGSEAGIIVSAVILTLVFEGRSEELRKFVIAVLRPGAV